MMIFPALGLNCMLIHLVAHPDLVEPGGKPQDTGFTILGSHIWCYQNCPPEVDILMNEAASCDFQRENETSRGVLYDTCSQMVLTHRGQ